MTYNIRVLSGTYGTNTRMRLMISERVLRITYTYTVLVQWLVCCVSVRGNIPQPVQTNPHPPTIQDAEMPPVVYSQTQGPVYIINKQQWYPVWCNVTEGATVSWTYNGAALPSGHFIPEKKINGDNYRLLIFDNTEDGRVHGYVQCHVTNKYGSCFGERTLVRRPVLQSVGKPDKTISAVEGDHVTLSCHPYVEHVPPASVHWTVTKSSGTHNIMDDDNFLCSEMNTTCVVSDVTREDSATYTCSFIKFGPKIAMNISINVTENTDHSVLYPLNLIGQVTSPGIMHGHLGETVTLRCLFRGTGYKIRWHYTPPHCDHSGEFPIHHGDKDGKFSMQKNNKVLKIADFSHDDEGLYSCISETHLDRYEHRMDVRLVQVPKLDDQIMARRIGTGHTARINCSSSAVPKANVTWWINSTPLVGGRSGNFHTEDEGRTLVLESASQNDTCSILCNVSNIVGHSIGYRTIYVSTSKESYPSTSPPPTDALIPSDPESEICYNLGDVITDCYGEFGVVAYLALIQKEHTKKLKTLESKYGTLEDKLHRLNNTWLREISKYQNDTEISDTNLLTNLILDISMVKLSPKHDGTCEISCTLPSGCDVSVSSPVFSNGSSGVRRSRSYHESRDISFMVEKKDTYNKAGALTTVRVRLTTKLKRLKKGSCKNQDDINVIMKLESPSEADSQDDYLSWTFVYKNPYNGHIMDNCAHEENKTRVNVNIEGDKSSTVKCWSNKRGANIHRKLDNRLDKELCRWTQL